MSDEDKTFSASLVFRIWEFYDVLYFKHNMFLLFYLECDAVKFSILVETTIIQESNL